MLIWIKAHNGMGEFGELSKRQHAGTSDGGVEGGRRGKGDLWAKAKREYTKLIKAVIERGRD